MHDRQPASEGGKSLTPAARCACELIIQWGIAGKVSAPLNNKYAGRSRLAGTFLWFVSFVEKK